MVRSSATTKISEAATFHYFAASSLHETICEGDNTVVVACSNKEKDVVVDCLIWQFLPQCLVTIHKTIVFGPDFNSDNSRATVHIPSILIL